MRPVIVPLAAWVALVAPLGAQHTVAIEPPTPVIVTTGGATASRAPDVAFVTLAVESRARSPRDAQRLTSCIVHSSFCMTIPRHADSP